MAATDKQTAIINTGIAGRVILTALTGAEHSTTALKPKVARSKLRPRRISWNRILPPSE
jgi:hypothetical protein